METGPPQLAQIALCTADMPRSVQLYSEVFGFADAGGRVLWGERVAKIQGTGEDGAFVLWWLVGRQDLVQLEFFHHTTPAQKALPTDWRPCDLGWVRFGIAVPDFEPVLARLSARGVPTITAPVVTDGLRRVCFRDPWAGCVVEVMEEGAATPGGIRPRFYDLAPALVYATLSVPDLGPARTFFCDTLGLVEEPDVLLHAPEHEALWGLDGASCESFVARGGDAFVEVVRYDDPLGRPKPAGHLLSDQGFMNVAVGFREKAELDTTYARFARGGYRDNHEPPKVAGGTYVNDAQGNSLELLIAPRELDAAFGFQPHPLFRRATAWPQASVPPATV
jgi:catechol 2,3-dioxygenase-like lactoylglutathione lyase family enzyme